MAIGMDLVEIARLRRVAERHPAFMQRVFAAEELAVAATFADARRYEYLAGRFATKEAVLKALGVGLSGDIALTDIYVASTATGAPEVRFVGAALDAVTARGLTTYEASISHDAGIAAAFVVLT